MYGESSEHETSSNKLPPEKCLRSAIPDENVLSKEQNVTATATSTAFTTSNRPFIKWQPLPTTTALEIRKLQQIQRNDSKMLRNGNEKDWQALPRPCTNCMHATFFGRSFLEIKNHEKESKTRLEDVISQKSKVENLKYSTKNETFVIPKPTNEDQSNANSSRKLTGHKVNKHQSEPPLNQIKMDTNTNNATLKPPSNILPPKKVKKEQCPICLKEFELNFSQIEKDGHLARCLSGVTDDVTW
ncbi:hypothetical protein HELRODRAFT_182367 [Helobdella robusta]|uniref:UBZ2-type domain-containing protein n=1 Tax=Helobdella robusta TaxID=6412 RepID=T1FI40_HELRO|nr:hypothetical protein HELRODRAFT_182367 [Helobdella robusta]ESN91020.1 hypothetical protein HELRODRAFT_182367 [Helobdella robusta]